MPQIFPAGSTLTLILVDEQISSSDRASTIKTDPPLPPLFLPLSLSRTNTVTTTGQLSAPGGKDALAISPSTTKSSLTFPELPLPLPPPRFPSSLSAPALATGVTIGRTVDRMADRIARAQTSTTFPSQVRTITSTLSLHTYLPGITQSADRSTTCGSNRSVRIAEISISSVRLRRLSPPATEVAVGRRSTLSSTTPSLG
mmetsp:Transcript_4592/g.11030  ORF Transcript_4592/g.11030 Transcript_4592/m.11030 type:complete len:200 (+) Transcript_4592:133-732(+)